MCFVCLMVVGYHRCTTTIDRFENNTKKNSTFAVAEHMDISLGEPTQHRFLKNRYDWCAEL